MTLVTQKYFSKNIWQKLLEISHLGSKIAKTKTILHTTARILNKNLLWIRILTLIEHGAPKRLNF